MEKKNYEQPYLLKLFCRDVLASSGDPFADTDNVLDDDKIN